MQMVKKVALFAAIILLSLAIFAPKRELYYLLEEHLAKEGIIISDEEISSGLFGLTLQHPKLYLKGINIAEIEEISVFTLLFYTSISIESITTDDSLRRWAPRNIDRVRVDYHIFNPTNIRVQLEGSFGSAEGYLSLGKNMIHIDLVEEGQVGALKPLLKKGEEGWYYETSF